MTRYEPGRDRKSLLTWYLTHWTDWIRQGSDRWGISFSPLQASTQLVTSVTKLLFYQLLLQQLLSDNDAFHYKKHLDKTCHGVVFSHTSDISLPCTSRYTSLAAASLASFLFLPVPSGYSLSPTKKWQCLLKCRSYWMYLYWQVSQFEWNGGTAQRLTAEHHLVPELVTQQPSLTTCSYDHTRLTNKHSSSGWSFLTEQVTGEPLLY